MKQKDTYCISVKLGVGCYRHIQIASNQTFEMLHLAILDAFDFCNDHAHAFFFGRTWADDHTAIYTDFIDDAERFSSKVKLHEMLEVGINFIYIFDFGDEWTFRCKVLKTLKSPLKEYQIIKSVGIAPPQYGEEDEEEDEEYEE